MASVARAREKARQSKLAKSQAKAAEEICQIPSSDKATMSCNHRHLVNEEW